jgi:hypothetical protein
LVPNGSFEEVPNCDGLSYNINSALPWLNPTEYGTPDLINSCNSNVVWFINQYQSPHTGLGYAGVFSLIFDEPNQNDIREYIQVQLIDTLVQNKFYKIEYYLSLHEWSKYGTNNLGMYISDSAIYKSGMTYDSTILEFSPQIKMFDNQIIVDTVNWIKVEAIYLSNGGENFITMGNFNTDLQTSTIAISQELSTLENREASYYVIDDISLFPLDSIPGGLPANAGPDQTIYIQDSVFIGQRIANLNCNWYELGGSQIASSTSGFYVQPLQTTTYVVEQILGADISYDTCTVFVEGLGLEENVLLSFEIYPNPSNGTLTLQSSQQINSPCSITITDMLGKVVYQSKCNLDKGQLILETDLSNGSYLLSVSNEKVQLFQERLVVIK